MAQAILWHKKSFVEGLFILDPPVIFKFSSH